MKHYFWFMSILLLVFIAAFVDTWIFEEDLAWFIYGCSVEAIVAINGVLIGIRLRDFEDEKKKVV